MAENKDLTEGLFHNFWISINNFISYVLASTDHLIIITVLILGMSNPSYMETIAAGLIGYLGGKGSK